MTRGQWGVVLGSFAIIIGLVNWILPIPDINDFTGLGQICLLMERHGLLRATNMNWGFASPLTSYLLTLLTHNLLVSQRILSGIACLAAIVCVERLMRGMFLIHGNRPRMVLLFVLICSPWMLESMVSCHLDIFPIALTVAAVGLVPRERPRALFIGGFLAAAGYWFRFHFLTYALLYIPFVLNYYWGREPFRKALFAASGVLVGWAIPRLLAIGAGQQVGTNIKMQVAYKTRGFSWNIDYLLALEKRSLIDIVRQVDVARILSKTGTAILNNDTLVLLICLLTMLCAAHIYDAAKATTISDARRPFYKSILPLESHTALIGLVLTPFLLIAPIRGITLRMQSGLFIVGFAALAYLCTVHSSRYYSGIVVAILVISALNSPFLLADYHERTVAWADIDRQVTSVIPESVRRDAPDKVLCWVTEYANKADRYWMWNPVMNGGWGILSPSFRDEFGYIDGAQLASSGYYEKFDYIILPRKPQHSFEGYDRKLLELAGTVHRRESVTILEMKKASTEK